MLLLISVPVVVAVIVVHRFLLRHAPISHLVRHVRTSAPTMRAAALDGGPGVACLVGLHSVHLAIEAGAPGVPNLLVLVFAWDAIKPFGSATLVLGRTATRAIRRLARRLRSRRCRAWARESRARRGALEPSAARLR